MFECIKCKKHQPISNFNKDTNNKRGFRSYCKACAKLDRDVRVEKNVIQYRAKLIKDLYGLSWTDYVKLFEEQEGRCAICGLPLKLHSTNEKALVIANVDHDHLTGKVRGLLCGNCNKAIGLFKDNYTVVYSAAKYLEVHQEN